MATLGAPVAWWRHIRIDHSSRDTRSPDSWGPAFGRNGNERQEAIMLIKWALDPPLGLCGP